MNILSTHMHIDRVNLPTELSMTLSSYSFRPRATPVIHIIMMIMKKNRIVEYL